MATDYDDIVAIRTYFEANYAGDLSQVVYDNDPEMDEPKGLWVRLSVKPGSSKRRGLNPVSYESKGRVYAQVFAPVSTGDGAAWQLAGQIKTMFQDLDLDNQRLRFNATRGDLSDLRSQDRDDKEPFFMVFVSIPYRAIH